MLFSRLRDKQAMVHVYNRIVFADKKKGSIKL